MPKAMHRALAKTARRRGYKGERYKRYVYGTLQKYKEGIKRHLSKKKKKKKKGKVATPRR